MREESSRPTPRLPLSSRDARRPLALLLCVGLAAGLLAHAAHADKGLNDGIYRDRSEKAHPWSIQRSHLLVWDEKPYAPAGVVFHSAYLKAPSPDNLHKDEAELDRLKGAGIEDVWVDPQRGLLECTPAQTQALVDALESRGFRYGLRVADRFTEPLIGFAPTLSMVRLPYSKVQPGARVQSEIAAPGGRRAVYVLAQSGSTDLMAGGKGGGLLPDDRQQNWAITAGEAPVERDRAQVQIQLRQSSLLGKAGAVLYVVPEVQVEPEDLGSFGDVWAGMPTYAERVKKHLQSVKFGPGLRFILDPFSAGDGSAGQEDQVFPSSPAFHKAFQEWLQHRSGIQSLNINWRTTDRRIPGFEEAARMVPTWSRNDPPDGDGWLIDPVDHVAYRCKPRQSAIWQDLDEFRVETLKRWMNDIPTTLKQEGLNVPMLFSWSAYHPLFNNSSSVFGYDGLGAQLSGTPASLGTESGAYALAQAEESTRNNWLIATRVSGPTEPSGNVTALGDAQAAKAAWDAIRDAGFRGIFLDPQTDSNAVAAAKELSGRMQGETTALQAKVSACFFPMPLATSDRLTHFANGVWWLPSSRTARLLRYGDNIMGYDIDAPFGDEHTAKKGTVLWSTAGKQSVSFFVDKYTVVEFFDSAGKPIKFKQKSKTEIEVPLTEEPVVATGLNVNSLFPVELAVHELNEFDSLLKQAEALKIPLGTNLRPLYTDARRSLGPTSAASVYQYVTPLVKQLREEMAPFVWLEGEKSVAHNFTGAAFQAGTSDSTFLKLDRKEAPPSGAYHARYNVPIRKDASYEIWIAGKVPGTGGVSPLIWQIDEETAVPVKSVEPVDAGYARGMAWYQIGRVTLKQGVHELTLVVPKRGDGPNGRFVAGIDAVVLSREPFKPSGATKPYEKMKNRAYDHVADPDEDVPGVDKPKSKDKKKKEKSDDKKPADKKPADKVETGN